MFRLDSIAIPASGEITREAVMVVRSRAHSTTAEDQRNTGILTKMFR